LIEHRDTTMRLSTAHAYDTTLEALTRRQSALTDAQLQLTTGKRVNRASDDPAAAAAAERALSKSSRADASQRSVEASKTMMSLTESALGEAGELLQQVREALVASGNASYTDAERDGVAQKIAGLREQLLDVANRSNGAGGFLFGGQGASQPPFVDAVGGVSFRGTAGFVTAAGEDKLPLSADGRSVWLSARTGNGVFETRAITSTGTAWIDAGQVTQPGALTGSDYALQFAVANGATTYSVLKDGLPTALANVPYASGKAIEIDGLSVTVNGAPANGDEFQMLPAQSSQSVFNMLDRAVADLKTPMRGGAQIAQSNSNDLRDIDSVMGQLQAARSMAGDALNRIDGVANRLDDVKLQASVERSNAEDLDMVHAIAEFQNQQTGYEAALKSYSMVQRMSLFNYLNV
jgi:flagellar hook-associated protein 3 FlgL